MRDGREKKRRWRSCALVLVLVLVAMVGGGCWLVNDHPSVSEAAALSALDATVDGSLGAISPPLSTASDGSYHASPHVSYGFDLKLHKTGYATYSRQQFVVTDIVPAKFASFREQEEKYWRSHGYTDIHAKSVPTYGGGQQPVLSATSPAGARITVTMGSNTYVVAGVDWVKSYWDEGDLPDLRPPGPSISSGWTLTEDPYWSH